MNRYVESMKNALVSYKGQKTAGQARVNQIREEYGPDAAQREQERQEKKLQSARAEAERQIREAYDSGVYQAQQWGKVDGSRITDDAKLLDTGIVDPDMFDTLKERYRDNATMLLVLKQFGERKNIEAAKKAQGHGDLPLSDLYRVYDIATLPDKMENWRQIQAQAVDMLDMIDGVGRYSDPWSQALGNAMGDQVLDQFGEGGTF